jgi:hypothetical protein
MKQEPVAIGGIGGSGTRLVAEILKQCGFYIGDVLNAENDNLWFTFLLKRRAAIFGPTASIDSRVGLEIFRAAMSGGPALTADQINWLYGLLPAIEAEKNDFQRSKPLYHALIDSIVCAAKSPRAARRWGWKEPNTHFFMDRLDEYFPGIRCIYVVRNGLDMAFSENQNQFLTWGPMVLGSQVEYSPKQSLKYWCAVHRKMLRLEREKPGRVLLFDFDYFSQCPAEGLRKLFDYLGLEVDEAQSASSIRLVRPLRSRGRFKSHDVTCFDAEDVEFVAKSGFDVSYKSS